MSDLDLTRLHGLPQDATIVRLAPRLWSDTRVAALWLGGSLASGAGDLYSDIDLRIAVWPDDLDSWRALDLAAQFAGEVVGAYQLRFGDDALLHHLALDNGDVLDFLVQSTARIPTVEPVLILGCRDDAFAHALDAANYAPDSPAHPATAEMVRQLIVDFWMNSHKHRKVLHRGLDLMILSGLYAERMLLLHLWYIQATGNEPDDEQLRGIHGLSSFVRAIQNAQGANALALVGAPVRTSAEIYNTIEQHRAAVAHIGRELAARHEFEYPEALERMVWRAWDEFKRQSAS